MKYYKKLGDTTAYTTKGKIYPSDYTGGSLNSVYTLADFYPADWQEVPAGDFYVQKSKMPEYFAIKKVANDPLWEEYIDWLGKKYNHIFDGSASWYGFDGSTTYTGMLWSSLGKFKNNPIELTLEQWDKIVNKTMEEFKLPEKWCVLSQGKDTYEKYLQPYLLKLKYEYPEWDGKEYYYHFSPGEVVSTKITKSGFTEITFEQFIKYVLKQEVMKENDKEIIGWILKDGCEQYTTAALNIIHQDRFYIFAEGYNFSNNSTNASDLKKAGVLELWFEPVYSQKFKVGDWVIGWHVSILEEYDHKAWQIVSINYKTDSVSPKENYATYITRIRLATPEEIKAAQTLKFGGYDVTFEKVTSGVRITCNGETGTLSQLEHIYNIVSKKERMMFGNQEVKQIDYSDDTYWSSTSLKATATSIKIGCTTGDWSEFVAIYEKAKSML